MKSNYFSVLHATDPARCGNVICGSVACGLAIFVWNTFWVLAISLCGNFGSKMNTFPSVDNFISEVSPNWSYRQKTGNNLLDFRFKYYFGARLPIRCNAGVFRSRFPNFKTSFKLCAFCLDSLMLYTSTSQRVFIQWVLLSLGQNYIKQSYSPY